MNVSVLWLRRDLRLADHPALRAALCESDRLVPVFCFDTRLLGGRHRSGLRTKFLLDCLQDLDRSLRARGTRLVVRHGTPERELVSLAVQVGAEAVHATADVGPFARRRDELVGRMLGRAGISLALHPGLFAVDDPATIRTSAGRPYTIFTPFYRAWLRSPRREALATPEHLPSIPARARTGRLPRLTDLGFTDALTTPTRGGERTGRARLEQFLACDLDAYASQRDALGSSGTSELSPFLHFGCISPLEVERALGATPGAEEFRRQLCWREFYAQVLHAHPANAHREHQQQYRGTVRWSHSRRRFAAWCEGRTGFPLVDAAMRQLLAEGWMHNRCRMVVGSLLTKDLGIDWRWGERWFMQHLIDGDEASNNGNWQWIASIGVDPQPPARRIYNPGRQQARFDPGGEFVRRYVPELVDVPDGYLVEPWTMPAHVQQQAGCVIGRDYPAPIVDHTQARHAAIARYAAARARRTSA